MIVTTFITHIDKPSPSKDNQLTKIGKVMHIPGLQIVWAWDRKECDNILSHDKTKSVMEMQKKNNYYAFLLINYISEIIAIFATKPSRINDIKKTLHMQY